MSVYKLKIKQNLFNNIFNKHNDMELSSEQSYSMKETVNDLPKIKSKNHLMKTTFSKEKNETMRKTNNLQRQNPIPEKKILFSRMFKINDISKIDVNKRSIDSKLNGETKRLSRLESTVDLNIDISLPKYKRNTFLTLQTKDKNNSMLQSSMIVN